MDKDIPQSLHHIHDSAVLLAIRIFFLLAVIEILYFGVIYGLLFTGTAGNLLENQKNYAIIFSSLLKFILQSSFLIYVVLAWVKNNYYLTDARLIHCNGIIKIKEDMYDLKGIHAISVYQGILGRLFNYGDLLIEVSASGGFHKNVLIKGIVNPKKYERILNEHLERKLEREA